MKLTHIALRAQNPGQSARFYEKFCNLNVQHRRVDLDQGQEVEVLWLSNHDSLPGFIMVLMQAQPEPAPQGAFHHLGFDVESPAEVDRLAQWGREAQCLALEAQDGGPVVGYFCALQDPDGNMVEFSYGQMIEPTPDN